MGHSEGICHVYVHEDADIEKSKKILVDAKTDYPSACNAVETILVHKSCGFVEGIIKSLVEKGVKVNGGQRAAEKFNLNLAKSFREEYGDLEVTIEIVDSFDQAVDHINKYGSSHTVKFFMFFSI